MVWFPEMAVPEMFLATSTDEMDLMHDVEHEREGEDLDVERRIPREREESLCPCKSRLSYALCCLPFHQGKAKPETAEQLMRSRYSAYFFRLVDYLVVSRGQSCPGVSPECHGFKRQRDSGSDVRFPEIRLSVLSEVDRVLVVASSLWVRNAPA